MSSFEVVSGVPVVAAPEEIDVTNAEALRSVLLMAAWHGQGTLVVDMTATRFCDSSGVRTLLAAHNRARAEDGELLLVIPDIARLRAFQIIGIDRMIPRVTSLDQALAQASSRWAGARGELTRPLLQPRDQAGRPAPCGHDEDMALQLAQEEPEAGPWRVELLRDVVDAVTRRGADRGSSGRPVVLAVDGRSNNGKTTVAARISGMVPGSAVIHTDDIAWEHSRFGWADLLVDGVLVPAHQGRAVSYRPPRWDEHGREGTIDVPAGCPLLIIEGDGAGRREVAHLIDTLIWVQADEREAARRSAARAASPPAADLANRAADGAPSDEQGWMAEEIPFNAAQRTWERADIIVCGTPELPHDPVTEMVIASPSRAR